MRSGILLVFFAKKLISTISSSTPSLPTNRWDTTALNPGSNLVQTALFLFLQTTCCRNSLNKMHFVTDTKKWFLFISQGFTDYQTNRGKKKKANTHQKQKPTNSKNQIHTYLVRKIRKDELCNGVLSVMHSLSRDPVHLPQAWLVHNHPEGHQHVHWYAALSGSLEHQGTQLNL